MCSGYVALDPLYPAVCSWHLCLVVFLLVMLLFFFYFTILEAGSGTYALFNYGNNNNYSLVFKAIIMYWALC